MKRIILLLFGLAPLVVYAGGGLNAIGRAIELMIIYTIITVLFLPPIIGCIVCLFFPDNRLRSFKKVTLYTLIILLAILTLMLLYFILL